MALGRHISYAKYLIRHKWYVTIECFKHGLIWRGLTHDLSKFRPGEWFPYARYFYASDGQSWQTTKRDKSGYYKPENTGDKAFDFAWLLHQKRNDHHWQWWICPQDDGGFKTIEMSTPAITEMICDWIGAGKAQGHGADVVSWYEKNRDKMILHPKTRRIVESMLSSLTLKIMEKIE